MNKKHLITNKKSERGLTLIEVTLAVLITSIISLAIYKIGAQATIAINQSAAEINSNVQIMSFSRQLRYDISGSNDLYVFDNSVPATASNLCSSWNSNSYPPNLSTTPPTFASLSNASKFVKPLFTVKVRELDYASANADPMQAYIGTWIPYYDKWYGYELRNNYEKGKAKPELQIWRTTCTSLGTNLAISNNVPNQDLLVLNLGYVNSYVNFNPNGVTTLRCNYQNTGSQPCETNTSTLKYDFYSFNIPYGPSDAPNNPPTFISASPLVSGSQIALAPGTYYLNVSSIISGVESLPGTETSILVAAGRVLTISVNTAIPGASAYKIYVGTSPGTANLKYQGTLNGIGTFTIQGSTATGLTGNNAAYSNSNSAISQPLSSAKYRKSIKQYTSDLNYGDELLAILKRRVDVA